MNRRAFLYLGFALVLGLSAAWMATRMSPAAEAQAPATMPVVVVRVDVPVAASLSPEEILGMLERGDVATWEVVVPEGFTAAQIGARLEAAGLADAAAFAAVVNDPATAAALGVEGDTLEGYLFPETYRLQRELEPLEVARAFVRQFLAVWQEIAPKAKEEGFSMKEVVTLASIVEKETGAPHERRTTETACSTCAARFIPECTLKTRSGQERPIPVILSKAKSFSVTRNRGPSLRLG